MTKRREEKKSNWFTRETDSVWYYAIIQCSSCSSFFSSLFSLHLSCRCTAVIIVSRWSILHYYDHLDNCIHLRYPRTIGFVTAASDLSSNIWWRAVSVYMINQDVQNRRRQFGLKQVSYLDITHERESGMKRGGRKSFLFSLSLTFSVLLCETVQVSHFSCLVCRRFNCPSEHY